MSIINKDNLKQAIQSNAEYVAVSKAFIAIAPEILEILKANITHHEKFGLINAADDLNVEAAQRAALMLKAKNFKGGETSEFERMMGGDAIHKNSVDFDSEEGAKFGECEGKKRAYRAALTALQAWKEEEDPKTRLNKMVDAGDLAIHIVEQNIAWYTAQGKIAEARLEELKKTSLA